MCGLPIFLKQSFFSSFKYHEEFGSIVAVFFIQSHQFWALKIEMKFCTECFLIYFTFSFFSAHSSGYFIASDSTVGNPILPVIPRVDDKVAWRIQTETVKVKNVGSEKNFHTEDLISFDLWCYWIISVIHHWIGYCIWSQIWKIL